MLSLETYTWAAALIQIAAALIMFVVINWLGKHSISDGYMQLSMDVSDDTSPAFNFVYKVLSPVVLLILFVTLFQLLGWDAIVDNCFFIVVYYWLIRIIVVIILGHAPMTDWFVQFIYWVVSLGLAYLVNRLADNVESLLPDPKSLLEELWILVILFLYSIWNKLSFGRKGSIDRKENYKRKQFNKFKNKYGSLIDSLCSDEQTKRLVYSTMIYENFNRPPFARFVERLWFRISKRECTLGIMQVKTNTLLNNRESIIKGVEIIKANILAVESGNSDYETYKEYYIAEIAQRYNPGDMNYGSEVDSIYSYLKYNKLV